MNIRNLVSTSTLALTLSLSGLAVGAAGCATGSNSKAQPAAATGHKGMTAQCGAGSCGADKKAEGKKKDKKKADKGASSACGAGSCG